MLVRLPTSLHYPITVTSLLKQPGDTVERNEALFWYVYETAVTEGDGLGNTVEVMRRYPARFETTVNGEIIEWHIQKGDVIDEP
jgi:RNA polymerase II subunit A-like phosphatase